MKTAIILLIFMPFYCMALSSDDELHLAAHAGTSFALQTTFYGINSRFIGLSKGKAEALAFIETMAIGLVYKIDQNTTTQDTGRAMFENALGAGTAIGLHYTFSF